MQDCKERNKKVIIFFAIYALMYGIYLLFDFPTFLFSSTDRYKDFATINHAVCDLNPYISGLSNYPPLILLFAILFAGLNDWTIYEGRLEQAFENPEYVRSVMILVSIYAVLLVITTITYAILINRRDKLSSGKKHSNKSSSPTPFLSSIRINQITNILLAIAIACVFALSAPSRYLIDRGNYLLITIIFVMLWAIFEDALPNSTLGAIFASLSAGTKIYPIMLLVDYIGQKKYRKLLIAVVTTVLAILVPICVFKGSYIDNLVCFVKGVIGFGGGDGIFAAYYTVGLTGLFNAIVIRMGFYPVHVLTMMIWIVGSAILLVTCLPLLSRERTTWRRLLILVSLMIFISPNSYLYNSCYLFAPILLMLFNKEKLRRSDIPYIVITALLLVPKSYIYFPNISEEVALEFRSINCAVIIDGLLYLALLLYYITTNGYGYLKSLIKTKDSNKLVLRLDKKTEQILKWIAVIGTALLSLYVLYECKDTILACHDSVSEYIDARVNARSGFDHSFKYGLARGRVSFIFPCVVGLRYLINSTDNFILMWLMQYVPIIVNITLIGYIISKRINKFYAFAFVTVFTGLLQIDSYHSLIICYPLDFMYGLFVAILGSYLFYEYLEKDSSSRLDLLRLIASLLCFYESMVVYESYIVFALVYAILAWNYVCKKCVAWKERAIRFVKIIAPFVVVALVYVCVLLCLRYNPVADIAVPEIDGDSSLGRFIITYGILSIGMFPLVDTRFLLKYSISDVGAADVIIPIVGAITFYALVVIIGHYYTNKGIEDRRDINRKLALFGACGLAVALTFAIPHALIPGYQEWITESHAGGYLPTSICYFGWAIVLLVILSYIAQALSRLVRHKRIVLTVGLAMIFGIAIFLTLCSNTFMAQKRSSNGKWFARRCQVIYNAYASDTVKSLRPTLVFSPDLSEVIETSSTEERFAEVELGYDIDVEMSYERFFEKSQALDLNEDRVYVLRYIDDVLILAPVVQPDEDYSKIKTDRVYVLCFDNKAHVLNSVLTTNEQYGYNLVSSTTNWIEILFEDETYIDSLRIDNP